MRIALVNVFERGNRGDAALLSVTIRQLRQTFPGAELSIAGFERPEDRPEFDGVPTLGSIRRYVGDEDTGRVTRVTRKVLTLGVAAFAALPGTRHTLPVLARLLPAEMRRELTAIARADLVVGPGGGYVNARDDFPSDINIALLTLPLWLAHRCRVPVALGPQSYGPFPRRFQRALLRRSVGRADRVMTRESISAERLEAAGVPRERIVRSVDAAFAFTIGSRRDWRAELGIPADATMVLMTTKDDLPPDGQAAYEEALTAAVRHMLARPDCHVVLVPQVTCGFQDDDDRIVNARLAAAVSSPRLHVLDDDRLDHHDVSALYPCADYIIGTRFHAVIFGLIARVPCVAIEYDHKTSGIMRDLGLERWVVHMADVRPGQLIGLIEEMMTAPDAYRSHLDAVLPGYAERATDFVENLRRTVPAVPAVAAAAPGVAATREVVGP
ncbi:polysaccharide pyruvyl transferase family protein [Streptomyces specialis]|uniref:polysaccharide pyruvyl transferase family protein n=1 Tax=Streptomyces specialis TaxID=498367 RepID=UPI00073F9738|nr:polysaccharide pyruvyl transferase family protein [Streptomyces specialis]